MKRMLAIKTVAYVFLALYYLGHATPVSADPLDLSDAPLFLNINVLPNILFLIDDSQTMDFEVMTKDPHGGLFCGTQPNCSIPDPPGSSVKHRDDNDNGLPDCAFAANGQTFNGYIYGTRFPGNTYPDGGGQNCNIADDQAWRFRNSDFNLLYFNPNRTYSPWPGLNAAGNPFTNMPITAAKDDPNDSNSPTIDLTRHNSKGHLSDRDGDGVPDGFRYYTWSDSNGNGLFDDGEETEHLIKDADPATQQNFANWFSYYRRRAWVAKAVYGDLIAQAENIRMGVVTFKNTGGANMPIRHMDGSPTVGDKRALLDALYGYLPNGNKKLRSSLYSVGQYLECDSGNGLFSSGECPALPADQGGVCQQNFVLLMTDGPYDSNDTIPSVGNFDGDGNTEFDGGACADSWSGTAADIAMHFYERDLHPGLDNNVPTIPGVDEATHQHMVTYAITFGVNGSLSGNPPNRTDAFSWPDPDPPASSSADSDAAKIDDLRHAAYNSRGLFLSATKPEELSEALEDALTNIAERTSSAASVALNSGSQNANSRVYQARFNSGTWSGQLLSFPVNADGNVATPEWDSGVVLSGMNYDTAREILTYNPNTLTGVPFRWTQLSAAQQTLLHTDADSNNDGEGQARLEYLRGSDANEGTGNNYRIRLSRLGDLINSDPFFVGMPSFPNNLGAGYPAFRSAYSGRTPMVYVGGNDGMLHGFNANNGAEELAYVPHLVFPHLSQLTDPGYSHRYFVDGSPTVGDAYGSFGSRCSSGGACWRSVLVSGLRNGGQGLFALDVTDPATFDESNAANLVLWEFSDADDADLGYTFSQPSIVKMANGAWAAVFGNGYNNSEPDGRASATGHAVLYVVFLDRGLDGIWSIGSDFIKIDTGVGSPATPNSLSTPAPVDQDGDFQVDYIYAGDLQGNLWRFDVRNASPSNWGPAVRLLTATSGGSVQPITTRPEVGSHPDPLETGLMVYFGTGKYLEDSDTNSVSPTQTFYGIWDKLETPPTVVTRSDLLQQTVVSETAGQRVTSKNEIDWQIHSGWYIDLPAPGERQVTDSMLRNGRIIFTTLIPHTKACSFGGTSWLMELDAYFGGRLENSPFDLNDDDHFDDNDKVTISVDGSTEPVAISGLQSTEGILPSPTILSSGTTEIKYNSGSRGGIFVTTENPGPRASGRQAWRQFR
jgi:type IV pilus assembly protein PilY1